MPIRPFVSILMLALVMGACGDALEGVGDLSAGIVRGDQTSTTTTAPGQLDLRLNPITQVRWINDELGAATAGLTPEDLLLAVWYDDDRRDDQVNEFVQASRREIADLLPGIEFPQLAPAGVSHVSSQLVYDIQTASLGVGTSAAFGLWVGEPYTAARSEAQLAVLRVGLKTFDDGSPDNEVFSFSVAGGRELSWVDGQYVYQLFCRTGVSPEACEAMADSTIPLSLLVSLPAPTSD
ncbi:MAG: hypothetical protein V3S62_00680 [Acidimicrobiia bacterium]